MVTIPVKAYPSVPAEPLAGKVVIDTGNYYPPRDGQIPDLDGGSLTSSELLQRHLAAAAVVKAFVRKRRHRARHAGRRPPLARSRLAGERRPGLMQTGSMMPKPVSLSEALATFDEIYSPRIVGRVNDYDIRIAHAKGEHVWHVHEHTDEFFLVLDGQFDVALRDGEGGEQTVTLRQGDVFIVPRGTEHKPSSPGGSILMFEPSDTSTTGDRHEGDIPDHVDSTTGHDLQDGAGR